MKLSVTKTCISGQKDLQKATKCSQFIRSWRTEASVHKWSLYCCINRYSQGRKTFSNFTKHIFFFPLLKTHNDIFSHLFRLILSHTQRTMWILNSMQGTDERLLPSSCVCSRSRHRAQTSESELNGCKSFVPVREMKFRQLQRKHLYLFLHFLPFYSQTNCSTWFILKAFVTCGGAIREQFPQIL